MRKFINFFKDRYVVFTLLSFYFDSDDYPEYSLNIFGITLRDWRGSLLYLRYEPDSLEEVGDGFEIDVFWLKSLILSIIDWIKDKFK